MLQMPDVSVAVARHLDRVSASPRDRMAMAVAPSLPVVTVGLHGLTELCMIGAWR